MTRTTARPSVRIRRAAPLPFLSVGAGRFPPHEPDVPHYVEHLRTADLSVGTYSCPRAVYDAQSGTREDEIYVVTPAPRDLRPTPGVGARSARATSST